MTAAMVCAAIAERRLLRFEYHGVHRVVYPCAHGWLSTGNEALRAPELVAAGGSRSVGLGKLFLLDSMTTVAVLRQGFSQPPHGYRPGDRGMAQIHCELPL